MGLFDNFGTGIGLQGQPRFFENMYGAANRQANAEAAKRSADDEKALESFQNDLVIKDVHRLDYNDAMKDASTTLSKVMDIKRERPNNWKNEARKIMQDFTLRQSQRVQRKRDLDAVMTDYKTRKDSKSYLTPDQEQAAQIINTGTWNDFNSLKSPLGYVKFNPNDKSVGMRYAPGMDPRAEDVKTLSDPELYTDTKFLVQNPKLPDGRVVMTTAQGIPVTAADADAVARQLGMPAVPSLESLNAKLLSDPNYMERKAAEMYYGGRLNGFENMTEQERYRAVFDQNMVDLKNIAGVKSSNSTVAPFKKSTAKEKPDKNLGFDEMLASGQITKNEKYLQGYGETTQNERGQPVAARQKELTSLYSMNIKASVPFVVNADSKTIHLANSTAFKQAEQFHFVPGSVKVIRVYKNPGKSSETVAVPYVFGKRVQYNPNERDEANTVKEIEDVAIPLEKVQQGLGSKPYEVPTKWAFEAADRENGKRNISGFPARSQEQKTTQKKKVY